MKGIHLTMANREYIHDDQQLVSSYNKDSLTQVIVECGESVYEILRIDTNLEKERTPRLRKSADMKKSTTYS